jgi:hypothetical protein
MKTQSYHKGIVCSAVIIWQAGFYVKDPGRQSGAFTLGFVEFISETLGDFQIDVA